MLFIARQTLRLSGKSQSQVWNKEWASWGDHGQEQSRLHQYANNSEAKLQLSSWEKIGGWIAFCRPEDARIVLVSSTK